ALDGTGPAAARRLRPRSRFPFLRITFRCTVASVARIAGNSWLLCSHHLFANLPLPTRLHACPAPADKVGGPRADLSRATNHRHYVRHLASPIQQHRTIPRTACYCYHLARRAAPDPALYRVLDPILSTLRH